MTPQDSSNFTAFFQSILDAITHRQWWPLASLVLIGLVSVTRLIVPKLHGKLGAFLNTDRGAALLVLFYAVVGAAGTTIGAWKRPDAALLASAVFVAVGGAGGFSLLKKIFFPSDGKPVDVPASAKMLPLVFASFFIASCACQKPENKFSPGCRILNIMVSCGGQAILDGLGALVEAVLPAIAGGSIDWTAVVQLEEKYGTDAVVCAMQKAVDMAQNSGASPAGFKPELIKKLQANKANIVANVKKYMASRNVQFVEASK